METEPFLFSGSALGYTGTRVPLVPPAYGELYSAGNCEAVETDPQFFQRGVVEDSFALSWMVS